MVDIDVDGLDDAAESIQRMGLLLEQRTPNDMDSEVSDLVSNIQRSIERKGLVDTGNLKNSFRGFREGKSEWKVRSTADYSMALEEGADPHPITPDKANVLSWEPQNPAAWVTNIASGSPYAGSPYDPETGRVYLSLVSHPGNREYEYTQNALRIWFPLAANNVSRSVNNSIRLAGFRHSVSL